MSPVEGRLPPLAPQQPPPQPLGQGARHAVQGYAAALAEHLYQNHNLLLCLSPEQRRAWVAQTTAAAGYGPPTEDAEQPAAYGRAGD